MTTNLTNRDVAASPHVDATTPIDAAAGPATHPYIRRGVDPRTLLEPDESATIPIAEARGEAGAWGRIARTYVRFTLDR